MGRFSFKTWYAIQDLRSHKKAILERSALSPWKHLIHFPLSVLLINLSGTMSYTFLKSKSMIPCITVPPVSLTLSLLCHWPDLNGLFQTVSVKGLHIAFLYIKSTCARAWERERHTKLSWITGKCFPPILFQTQQILLKFRRSYR